VLLLEAGDACEWNPWVKIPLAVVKLFGTDLDWKLRSGPEPTLDGKEVYLIRGKVMYTYLCTHHVYSVVALTHGSVTNRNGV
jgi:hypothetical protein